MSRRTLYILLFASLALNLFILGAVAGAAFLGGRFHHPRPGRGAPPMFAAAAVLSEPERGAYVDALRGAAAEAGPKLRQARAIRREAFQRLGADPVDSAGVMADLDQARALETQARQAVDQRIVNFTAQLPAADRARLAQALAAPPPHRRRRGPPAPP